MVSPRACRLVPTLAVLALGAAALATGPVHTVPARAANTACASPSGGPAAVTVALGQTRTVTVPANNPVETQYVCPVTPGGRPTEDDVLDVTATAGGSADFFACLSGIPDTGELTSTTYGRTSHAAGSRVERTAVAAPGDPEYEVDEVSVARGVGTEASAAGCSEGLVSGALGPSQPYTLTISYLRGHPSPSGNGFSFSTVHLPAAAPSTSAPGGGEPTVAVDRLHGDRVYVSTPVGVPSGAGCGLNALSALSGPTGCDGVNFWFSTDAGSSFRFCNASLPNGGGDSHVVTDTTGSIYSADLAASNVDLQKLSATASGPPTPAAGASCGFANLPPNAPETDRPWLATYLPDPSKGTGTARVYLGYHDLAAGLVLECTSNDGGSTFGPCLPAVTDPGTAADAAGNTVNGNQVTDSSGAVYTIFATSTVPDNVAGGGAGALHNIYVASSADGSSFSDHAVYLSTPQGTGGTQSVDQIFPVIAVDRSDNLYAVWSQGPDKPLSDGTQPTDVLLSSSTDHGVHWSTPTRVDSGGLRSNVLPWVVAGTDGRVDVVWVGSGDANPDDPRADWSEYMAQSLDAHDATPSFSQTLVSPRPIRRGDICFAGLDCTFNGDDGRILLDFTSVAVDSRGMAAIAYGDAGPDTETVGSGFDPYTDFAHQTGGTSLFAAPAGSGVAGSSASNPPASSSPSASASAGGTVSPAAQLPNTMAGGAGAVPSGLAVVGLLAGGAAASRRRRRRDLRTMPRRYSSVSGEASSASRR